jgi:hypothetical protein
MMMIIASPNLCLIRHTFSPRFPFPILPSHDTHSHSLLMVCPDVRESLIKHPAAHHPVHHDHDVDEPNDQIADMVLLRPS